MVQEKLFIPLRTIIMEKHYRPEEVESLINQTKAKISRARDGQKLGEKLAWTVGMMLPVSFEGPIAGMAIERGEYFPGILVPIVTQYSGGLLDTLKGLPSEYNILLDLAGWGLLIYGINYFVPKAMLAYEKRKVSNGLENSKKILKETDADILDSYGSMLEEALAEKSPYKYPVLHNGNFKGSKDPYDTFGRNDIWVTKSGLGVDSWNIKYSQP